MSRLKNQSQSQFNYKAPSTSYFLDDRLSSNAGVKPTLSLPDCVMVNRHMKSNSN